MLVPASSLSVRTLMRNGLVLAGLLFLSVGMSDTIAGRSKIAQYQELLQTTAAPPAPVDPTALFPTASEAQERQELARAKLSFYHLLVMVGQLLTAAGLVLIAAGIVQLRMRAVRVAVEPSVFN